MKIITVLPLQKGILGGNLTYFSALDIPAGHIVSVPVRNKKILALVISSAELKEQKSSLRGADFSLRKVTDDKGNSIFLPEFLETAFDTAKFFAKNKSGVAVSLIPNILINSYEKIKNLTPSPSPWQGEGGQRPGEVNKLKPEKLLFQYPLPDRISVYKTMIRESFARGQSVFMVLPTETDINKFTEYLSKGIERFVFPTHSGFSAKKILAAYEKILASSHPILVLGTVPFLSIPRRNIGTIILERESSNAYRTIKRPHLDLRIFAEIYASKIGAKFILADEMLRLETIERKELDNLASLHPLSFRIDFGGKIEVIGPEENPERKSTSYGAGKKFQVLKEQNVKEIKMALKNKENVFIFSLRKGLATQTLCRDCGDTLACEQCGAPLVLYLSREGSKRIFACNRCQREASAETVCDTCGSWNLVPLGIGTDTVQEEVKEIFGKGIKIFKLDKDSVKTAKEAQKIAKEFENSPGSILVGTEMAFFYLKNKVPLSVIASFDSLWSIPSFRMSEKIIQIFLSIINNTTEKIIIQTKNENDSVIRAFRSGNLLPFAREELEDRKKLGYPPFKRFIKITHLGDKEQTTKARNMLEEIFKDYNPEIFSGFVARLKGKYVTNTLIKMNPQKWSLPELKVNSVIDQTLLDKLLSLPPNFEVLVDPEDLL